MDGERVEKVYSEACYEFLQTGSLGEFFSANLYEGQKGLIFFTLRFNYP